VFPYFLFTGVLVKRIYAATAEARTRYPGVEILDAPYLNDHPLVIETMLDRIREMLVGQNLMNCSLCKYREQVLGFEAEVGLAQASHHHHVEGIGGGLENCPCGGDCDGSCRDEAFCRAHGLPWTPLHTHAADADRPRHDHRHGHARPHALPASAPPPLAAIGAGHRHGHDHRHDHAHAHPPGHGHSHDHGHGHHHHPYPHADH